MCEIYQLNVVKMVSWRMSVFYRLDKRLTGMCSDRSGANMSSALTLLIPDLDSTKNGDKNVANFHSNHSFFGFIPVECWLSVILFRFFSPRMLDKFDMVLRYSLVVSLPILIAKFFLNFQCEAKKCAHVSSHRRKSFLFG